MHGLLAWVGMAGWRQHQRQGSSLQEAAGDVHGLKECMLTHHMLTVFMPPQPQRYLGCTSHAGRVLLACCAHSACVLAQGGVADTFSQLGEKADCISRVYRETSGKPASQSACLPLQHSAWYLLQSSYSTIACR